MYQPKYKISNQILKNVASIEAAKEIIDRSPLVPAWEKKFQEDAVIRTVHHGTHLEGNVLSFREVEKVVQAEATQVGQVEVVGKQRDVQEVINYREVMEYLDKLKATSDQRQVTEEMLKEIHRLTVYRILPEEEAGKYRRVKVVIRNTQTGEITFRPAPPAEVPFLIRGFFDWLNSPKGMEVHPVLRSGIVHYELARIHPFTDGNGRTARAMALLVLYLEGYEIKKFFSLEEYYDRNPADYYTALRSVSGSGGDMTQWLEYFTLGIAVELNRVKEQVEKLSLDLKLKGSLGGKQIALSERQIELIEYMEKYESLTMAEGRELLPMVSDDTILRDLRDLIKKGLVKRKGKTKGVRYFLST